MAVPKRRTSRSRTRSRRAQWRASPPTLTRIVIEGREVLIPPRLVRFYRRYPEQLPG